MYHGEANKRKAKLIMAFYWNALFWPSYYLFFIFFLYVWLVPIIIVIIEAHCFRTTRQWPASNHSLWRGAIARNISFETLYGGKFTLLTMLMIPKLSWTTSVTRAGFVTLSNSFKVVYVSHATSVIDLFAFSGAVVVVISTDLGFTRSSFLREKACTLNGQKKKIDY